jgi:hypothetical protein
VPTVLPSQNTHDCRRLRTLCVVLYRAVPCCDVLCTRLYPAVSEKSAHLGKLLEGAKWRVMGYKGDDSDGQPLVHPVRYQIQPDSRTCLYLFVAYLAWYAQRQPGGSIGCKLLAIVP